MTTSSIPPLRRNSRMCAIIGRPATGMSGFGQPVGERCEPGAAPRRQHHGAMDHAPSAQLGDPARDAAADGGELGEPVEGVAGDRVHRRQVGQVAGASAHDLEVVEASDHLERVLQHAPVVARLEAVGERQVRTGHGLAEARDERDAPAPDRPAGSVVRSVSSCARSKASGAISASWKSIMRRRPSLHVEVPRHVVAMREGERPLDERLLQRREGLPAGRARSAASSVAPCRVSMPWSTKCSSSARASAPSKRRPKATHARIRASRAPATCRRASRSTASPEERAPRATDRRRRRPTASCRRCPRGEADRPRANGRRTARARGSRALRASARR